MPRCTLAADPAQPEWDYKTRLVLTLALALGLAAPAAANEILSPDQRAQRYERCVSDYGSDDADRCLELTHPGVRMRRALRDYHLKDYRERRTRERACWDDPRIINPRSCSEGHAPVFSK